MPRYNFAQEQILIARGRNLQSQAIRQGFAALFRLPGRLADALGNRAKAAREEGHRPA